MDKSAKAYWLWYPGDFELYHAMKQNFSRVERGCAWPAFWKSEGFRSDAERGRAAAALARCYYALGMIDEAVKLQNRSVMWLRGAPDEKRLIRDLALYRDAQETAREVRRREVKK